MRTTLFILALVATSIASAQITKSGQAYLFRMKHQVGSTLKYSVVSKIDGMGSGGKGMGMTLPMVWKVVSVKNGVATVDTTVGPVTAAGSVMMQATKNRIQIDSKGKVIGTAGGGQQVTPALPDKPIRIGQSWSSTSPISLPTSGQAKVTAKYLFKGFKMVDGKQMAELGVTTSGQAAGNGTMLLMVSDGSLFRSNLKMSLKVTNPDGSAGSYQVSADITRT